MLNIAEILRRGGLRAGVRFYSPLYGEVRFSEVLDDGIGVYIMCDRVIFNRYGQVANNWGKMSPEPMLFPSKDDHDWETFAQLLKKNRKIMQKDL